MSTIRAFIAIELPLEIRSQLEATIRKFKAQKVQAVRWVAVDNIHLTLKFLGDISSGDLGKLTNILQNQISSNMAFPVQVAGVGVFPNPRRPRIIWVGLQTPPELIKLQTTVEKAASLIGIPPEDRGFSPHLTLGRVR
ncbi:RNA 2',3'-cyclic phosphodiesterase, partial [bacterium]|nr:RNA 2',3'-cyclic phosphodiesterase [bacterium]